MIFLFLFVSFPFDGNLIHCDNKWFHKKDLPFLVTSSCALSYIKIFWYLFFIYYGQATKRLLLFIYFLPQRHLTSTEHQLLERYVELFFFIANIGCVSGRNKHKMLKSYIMTWSSNGSPPWSFYHASIILDQVVWINWCVPTVSHACIMLFEAIMIIVSSSYYCLEFELNRSSHRFFCWLMQNIYCKI